MASAKSEPSEDGRWEELVARYSLDRGNMITEDVKDYAERSVLCWLATTDGDNMPSVSPKEIFTVEDDVHVLIANIASPGSVRNVDINPKVCVSFIDVFVQKGYKLKGTARIIRSSEPEFLPRVGKLLSLAGGFPIRSIIAIEVQHVSPIIAPRYRFTPDTTESAQIESAMRTYSVRPR